MLLTAQDFEKIGFWEDVTPEEQIVIYGMDFDGCYLVVTDELGKTPTDGKAIIVAAVYDDSDCFLWGKELKNFAALQELCSAHPAASAELLQAIESYQLPKK